MTFDELVEKILDILPEATFGEDNDGQIVVYTNLQTDTNVDPVDGLLISMGDVS